MVTDCELIADLPAHYAGTEIAWHYTDSTAYDAIRRDGMLKSRALLLSERLRARPDWDEIKGDRARILEVITDWDRKILHPLHLASRPIIWFSTRQDVEMQAEPVYGATAVQGYFLSLSHAPVFDAAEVQGRLVDRPSETPHRRETQNSDLFIRLNLFRLGMRKSKLKTWHEAHVLTSPFLLGLVWKLSAVDKTRPFYCWLGHTLPLSEIERIERHEVGRGWTPIESPAETQHAG